MKFRKGGIEMKRHDGTKLVTVTGGAGVPPEPDWSKIYPKTADVAAARGHWGVVTRELSSAQTLAVANGNMIERLVHFRVEFERAARHVAKHGTVIEAKRSGVPAINVFWPVMRQASESLRTIEIELGLPPVRRGKVGKVNNAQKTPRPADAYLRAKA
jgi:phage terminase small subunit